MTKGGEKSKMTLDKLATMTQNEFLAVRKEVDKGFSEFRGDVEKLRGDIEDLRIGTHEGFSMIRKEIVEEVRDVVREESTKVIASNDRVATKLDDYLKDRAAHDKLHGRITDDLHHHDQRIKKLEAKV